MATITASAAKPSFFLAALCEIKLSGRHEGKVLGLGRYHHDWHGQVTQGSKDRASIEALAKKLVAEYPEAKGNLMLVSAPYTFIGTEHWTDLGTF